MEIDNNKLGHLNALEAAEFLQKHPEAKLIDIRSSMEFLFIGHPVDSIHIGWMEEPDWDINPNFVEDIKAVQTDNSPIVMICRSGNRSEKAGVQLLEAGLSNIYHISDGFEGERDDNDHRSTLNGWRFFNLPWEQC